MPAAGPAVAAARRVGGSVDGPGVAAFRPASTRPCSTRCRSGARGSRFHQQPSRWSDLQTTSTWPACNRPRHLCRQIPPGVVLTDGHGGHGVLLCLLIARGATRSSKATITPWPANGRNVGAARSHLGQDLAGRTFGRRRHGARIGYALAKRSARWAAAGDHETSSITDVHARPAPQAEKATLGRSARVDLDNAPGPSRLSLSLARRRPHSKRQDGRGMIGPPAEFQER